MEMLRSILRREIVQECKYIHILYHLGIYCFACVACNLVSGVGFTMASNAKRSELNLRRNIDKNLKNFEVQFDDYCFQANYRDITKDALTTNSINFGVKISSAVLSNPKHLKQTRRNCGYGWEDYASITLEH